MLLLPGAPLPESGAQWLKLISWLQSSSLSACSLFTASIPSLSAARRSSCTSWTCRPAEITPTLKLRLLQRSSSDIPPNQAKSNSCTRRTFAPLRSVLTAMYGRQTARCICQASRQDACSPISEHSATAACSLSLASQCAPHIAPSRPAWYVRPCSGPEGQVASLLRSDLSSSAKI